MGGETPPTDDSTELVSTDRPGVKFVEALREAGLFLHKISSVLLDPDVLRSAEQFGTALDRASYKYDLILEQPERKELGTRGD
jgi:hypothetical protein